MKTSTCGKHILSLLVGQLFFIFMSSFANVFVTVVMGELGEDNIAI